MRTDFRSILFLLALSLPLPAQDTMDTWVMTDGRMFQAALLQASPGELTVRLSNGKEEVLFVSELSELSKKRAAERLGLGAAAVVAVAAATTPSKPAPSSPETPSPTPTPAPAPGGQAMAQPTLGEGELSMTDAAAIETAMGTEITAVGIVREVATLGSTGHKKILFQGTPVVVFIGKWHLEKSGDWKFDDLEGKTLRATGKVGKFNDEVQVQPISPSDLQAVSNGG
jgi:hypothetical protein